MGPLSNSQCVVGLAPGDGLAGALAPDLEPFGRDEGLAVVGAETVLAFALAGATPPEDSEAWGVTVPPATGAAAGALVVEAESTSGFTLAGGAGESAGVRSAWPAWTTGEGLPPSHCSGPALARISFT